MNVYTSIHIIKGTGNAKIWLLPPILNLTKAFRRPKITLNCVEINAFIAYSFLNCFEKG